MTVMEITDKTVGELAVAMPHSIRVFEAWKIDYCCGGQTPLPVACAAKGRTVDEFIGALERTAAMPDPAARDWPSDTLAAMAAAIVAIFHTYTRDELQTLLPLADKVVRVHGARHTEMQDVARLVRELEADLLPHMLKEEQVLFPYVSQLEEAAAGRRDAITPFFGTVRNPVRMMMAEHDRAGDLLASLRAVTGNYEAPYDACFSHRELYRRLAEFEQRTHEHVHLENNLYFPRAVALEDRAGSPLPQGEGCSMTGCHH